MVEGVKNCMSEIYRDIGTEHTCRCIIVVSDIVRGTACNLREVLYVGVVAPHYYFAPQSWL